MSHRPRKRFGQNFLQSASVIGSIISAINPQPQDCLIEIGPGLGALTLPLLQRLPRMMAIEIDKDLQQYWSQLPAAKNHLELLGADALTVDFSRWGMELRVVGNLPYNISTPLLLHLLAYASNIKDMHFMLQKEVALRLVAAPGNKDYGRLSIITQYFCEADLLFEVEPQAFHPQPKVDSAVVRLTPYAVSPFDTVNAASLQKVVAQAFGMRRKTLANNLKPMFTADQLREMGLDPGARPEQLSVRDYVKLATILEGNNGV